jgi:hypothetical protein
MKNLKGVLFTVAMVGLIVVCISTGKAFAIASPCEQLAALENRIDRMEQELEEMDSEAESFFASSGERLGEINAWFNEQLSEMGHSIYETYYPYAYFNLISYLDTAEAEASEQLDSAETDAERAVAQAELDRIAALREEANSLINEANEIEAERVEFQTERNELRARLEEEKSKLTGLMAECGVITEMEDPMSASAYVTPAPEDEGPREPLPISPASSQEDTQTGVQLVQPRTETSAAPRTPTRVFHKSPARVRNYQGAQPNNYRTETMQVNTGRQQSKTGINTDITKGR